MKYDKKSFLAGLTVGMQLKGWAGIGSIGDSTQYYEGAHFKSFWDMSKWTVRIMAYREASNTNSNYLYEYTMNTLPDTLTIPYALIKNEAGSVSNPYIYYPLHIVIETPHELVGKKFTRYSMRFPALSESAVQYNPYLNMEYGSIRSSSAVASTYFFSGIGVGTSYDLSENGALVWKNLSMTEKVPNTNYGEGCGFQFDTLKVSAVGGSFAGSILAKTANCLCAEISISNADNSTISGSFTLDFTNFFIDLI